ncbi:MAG TPA: HEAT repeat domain-containing protein [Candidatus Polarisedimenticolaceae bacterium]|nr:HEAT repeat domain-containing protein [Candidatus Polarisedimenticolaceae bacterium]
MLASRKSRYALVVTMLAAAACSGRGAPGGLTDPDPAVRSQAAIHLGERKAPDGVDQIVPHLNDPELTVRIDFISALGALGDPRAVPAIIPYASDSLSGVRIAACRALGLIGDPRAVPALESALQDPDETIRTVAAKALGNIPGPESMQVLLRTALADESEAIRSHVMKVIAERHEKDAVPKLESALSAESDLVRANAALALANVGDRSSVPALIRALDDPYYKVRCLAAHALAKLAPGDAEAKQAIVKRLGVETTGMVRVDLAWAAGKAGDVSHLGVVRTLLIEGQPEDVRAEAALALGQLGGPSDVPILERALADKKGLVRSRAAEAIDRIKGAKTS